MNPSRMAVGIVAAAISVFSSVPVPAQEKPPAREIAITFDDLPATAASPARGNAADILEMTAKLLAILKKENVPATGFVNEQKVYKWGEVDQRIKALTMWLDAGFELGNHTYSHISLNTAGKEAFEENVIEGEPLLNMLLAEHKMKLRYFRHPYLDTGLDLQTRREVEAFLAQRGYRIAPVTMDAWDWMYAGYYDRARERGDKELEQKIASAYLSYTETVFAYYEKAFRALLGYEPRQILLVHGSMLNAEHFGEVIALLRKRGYRFISLQDALEDDAYSLPDTFVADEGSGWFRHWAVTMGKPRTDYPHVPADLRQQLSATPAKQ